MLLALGAALCCGAGCGSGGGDGDGDGNPPARITLTAPDGGEVLHVGEPCTITWEADAAIAAVTLLRSSDSGQTYPETVALDTPNDGHHEVAAIPASWAGTHNRIRVQDAADADVCDDSDADFTVLAGEQAGIAVLAPAGSDTLTAGEPAEIRWSAPDTIAAVRIDLSLDAGETFPVTVTAETENDGAFIWDPVPPEAVGRFARLRICDATDDTACGTSAQSFTVEPASMPTLQLTGPDGGETWGVGLDATITWTGDPGIDAVRLLLSTDGGATFPLTVSASTPNDGAYTWVDIPAAAAGERCRIRIEDADDAAVHDVSESDFRIRPAEEPVVLLTRPNGGEVWGAGLSGEIRWSASPGIAAVAILLSHDSGATFPTTIVARTPSSGEYLWSVIPAAAAGDTLRIRVANADDPAVYDDSDADFAIRPADVPVITVTAPDGGETWTVGSDQEITWTASPSIAAVAIALSTDGGETFDLELAATTPNDGSFIWTDLPAAAAGRFLRVRVADADQPGVFDVSDGSFTIDAPTVDLLAPDGGEIWQVGRPATIRWSADPRVAAVALRLSLDAGVTWPLTITSATPGDGEYTWDPVPEAAASPTCRVRVEDVADPQTADTSRADFTIQAVSEPPVIEVRAPDGGETWTVGSDQEITWTASPSIAAVRIDLSRDAGETFDHEIVAATPNDGAFIWTDLPAAAAGRFLRVRVADADDPTVSDISDASFTIAAPAVDLLAPDGGEIWQVGAPATIRWSADPEITEVALDLSLDGGATWAVGITPATASDGAYTWAAVPAAAGGTACRVRVRDVADPEVQDVSAADFTIQAVTEPPVVEVHAPDGGETWTVGTAQEITWAASPSIAEVRIELSGDGGATFGRTVIAATPNDGSFVWPSVPASAASRFCRVRVADAADPDVLDVSDASFTIADPSIQLAAPNGGEVWQVGGDAQLLWTADPDIATVALHLSLDGGATYPLTIAPTTPNDGELLWTGIPPEAAGHACRVRIADASNGQRRDASDDDFSILAPGEAMVTVTAPNGGEVWTAGTTRTITWAAAPGIASVRIDLSRDGGATFDTVVAASTPNDGAHDWAAIPLAAMGEDRRIRVADVARGSVFDTSDAGFRIVDPADLYLDVTAPADQARCPIGAPLPVAWDWGGDLPAVDVWLAVHGGADAALATGLANTGAFLAPDDTLLWLMDPAQFTWDTSTPLALAARLTVRDAGSAGPCDASDTCDEVVCRVPLNRGLLEQLIAASTAGDRDDDRLPDDVEAYLGTDPDSADTDRDGWSDYSELCPSPSPYAVLPDQDGDGLLAPSDDDDDGDGINDGEGLDSDGDGIADYLESYGYTYSWSTGQFLKWDEVDYTRPYFKTDPQQASSDQDPYPEAMEVTGASMDVSVRGPGDRPMVPASPDLVVELVGYDVTLNETIEISAGSSLSKESNWSRQTQQTHSFTDETHWEDSVSTSLEIGLGSLSSTVSFSHTWGGSHSFTNTTSHASSVGGSVISAEEWSRARSYNPTDAARLKLYVKMHNYGTACASNIIPTLTLRIGCRNVATFEPGNSQVNILEPGAVYPAEAGVYWVIDAIDTEMGTAPLSLTMDELRALETGAPVSLSMTQVLADVMSMDAEGHWQDIGAWYEYLPRINAVSANLFLDPGDGNFVHYLVYADDAPTAPRITFGDALMWVAGGHEAAAGPAISYFDRVGGGTAEAELEGWSFCLDEATLELNREAYGLDLADPAANAFDLVLTPDTSIVGKAPGLGGAVPPPTIHFAYLDRASGRVATFVSDYHGLDTVTFFDGAAEQPLARYSGDCGFWFLDLAPGYVVSGGEEVRATNLRGGTASLPVQVLHDIDPTAAPAITSVELDFNELTVLAVVEPAGGVQVEEVVLQISSCNPNYDYSEIPSEVPLAPHAYLPDTWAGALPPGYHGKGCEILRAVSANGVTATAEPTLCHEVTTAFGAAAPLSVGRFDVIEKTYQLLDADSIDFDGNGGNGRAIDNGTLPDFLTDSDLYVTTGMLGWWIDDYTHLRFRASLDYGVDPNVKGLYLYDTDWREITRSDFAAHLPFMNRDAARIPDHVYEHEWKQVDDECPGFWFTSLEDEPLNHGTLLLVTNQGRWVKMDVASLQRFWFANCEGASPFIFLTEIDATHTANLDFVMFAEE